MKTYLTVVAAKALAESGAISEPDLQALDDERIFDAFFDATSGDEALMELLSAQPDSAVLIQCLHAFGAAVMFIHEQDACGEDFEDWDCERIRKVVMRMQAVDAYDCGLDLLQVGDDSHNKRVIDSIIVHVVKAYHERSANPYDFSSEDFRALCRVCFNIGVTFVYKRNHHFADLEVSPRPTAVGAPLDCDVELMRKFGEIADRYFKHEQAGRSEFVGEFADLAKQGCTEAWNMCGYIEGRNSGDFDEAAKYHKRASDEGSGFGSWQLAASVVDLDLVIDASKRGLPDAMEFLSGQLVKENKAHLALYWHNLAVLCGLELENDNVSDLVDAVRANPVSFEESGFPEMGLNEAEFEDVVLGSDDRVFTIDDVVALARKGSQLAALQSFGVYEGEGRFAEANKILEDLKSTVARPIPMILRNLGDNYYRGIGGDERKDAAMELWYQAASREESACMFTMSLLLREKDPMVASYWLVGSFLRGYEKAIEFVKKLYGEGAL